MTAGVISAVALAGPAAGRTGGVSRSRADAIALQTLGTKDLAGMIALFGEASPLPAGTTVGAWSLNIGRGRMPVVRLRHRAWLFWEDLIYGAELAHPSELLLVDAVTGRVLAQMNLNMEPLINGAEPPFAPGAPGYFSRRYVVYSTVSLAGAAADRSAAPDAPAAFPVARAADGKITEADLAGQCLITIGDRGRKAPEELSPPNNMGDRRFKEDLNAIDAWAQSIKLAHEDAPSTYEGLKETTYKLLLKGCRDFMIYIAGHGLVPNPDQVGEVKVHYGDFAPPKQGPGSSEPGIQLTANLPANAPAGTEPTRTLLTPTQVSNLIDLFREPGPIQIKGKEVTLTAEQVKGIKFKLKLQSCFAGWWAKYLFTIRDVTPGEAKPNSALAVVEASSSATEPSWFHITTANVLVNGKEEPKTNGTTNPKNLSEATNANIYGLTAWANNPTGGRTLEAGLQQAFPANASDSQDFTRVIGYTHPQVVVVTTGTVVGDPDPSTKDTEFTTKALPGEGGQGVPPGTSYTCVGPVNMDLFNNWNGGAVGNGGAPKTFNTGGQHYCVVSINDYHWNSGLGSHPGTIALRTANGTLGPYAAVGSTGSPSQAYPNGVPDANWTATPTHQVVIDGTFTCVDSDPATWSQNPASGGAGFCKVYVQLAQPAA